MKTHILPAIKLTIVCMLFFMGIYTLAMFGIAQFAPNNGKGFVIESKGKKILSRTLVKNLPMISISGRVLLPLITMRQVRDQ